MRTWLDEVGARVGTTPHLVVVGGPNEQHLLPRGAAMRWHSTSEALTGKLASSGYDVVISWDPVAGLRVQHSRSAELAEELLSPDAGRTQHTAPGDDRSPELREILGKTPDNRAVPGLAALVVTGVERLAEGYDRSPIREVFTMAQQQARPGAGTALTPGPGNTVIWLVDREHDLPPWYLATQGVRVISIAPPDRSTREAAALAIIGDELGPEAATMTAGQMQQAAEQFAVLCQGMTLAQMREAGRFARDRAISPHHLEDAVRGIRSGLTSSPWQSASIRRDLRIAPALINGKTPQTDPEKGLARRLSPVLGQTDAVRKAFDVVTRSYLGMTDWDRASDTARPRGVLFFAGPTGVGKTELARQLAAAVFERAEAMTRFDMSEYSAEHSEARLIGAPPGYTGHEGGGQLTNAVRQQPFSLLLFDEIDKAHSKILDKFLQILEDGRLTDGSGSTVYFGESLIVFTSNLGIYKRSRTGQASAEPLVPYGTPHSELVATVNEEITRYFTEELQRPELLNRIGDNIVIFGYLDVQTARDLAARMIDSLARSISGRLQVTLTIGPDTRESMLRMATTDTYLVNGGRGVKNAIEAHLVNPLARQLLEVRPGQHVRVSGELGPGLRVDIR